MDWPTSVSTVQPRAVSRQAVVVSGIGTVTTALPSAPVMTEGSQRPSPPDSRRGAVSGPFVEFKPHADWSSASLQLVFNSV